MADHCAECGIPFPFLEKDHIIPRFLGGTDDPDNIRYLCPNCHRLRHGGHFGGPEAEAFRRSPETNARVGKSVREFYRKNPDKLAERQEKIRAIKKGGNPDRWSNHHDKCVDCGTTEKRHASEGRCTRCHRYLIVHGVPWNPSVRAGRKRIAPEKVETGELTQEDRKELQIQGRAARAIRRRNGLCEECGHQLRIVFQHDAERLCANCYDEKTGGSLRDFLTCEKLDEIFARPSQPQVLDPVNGLV